jgi:glycosyltransferase involved in cell wall biosynthesis
MSVVMTAEPRARRAPRCEDAAASPRPLRICFLIDELATAGTETQLLALIRRLDRGRFAPYLCLLRGDRPRSRALEPDDCVVSRLGVGSLCRPSTMAKMFRFARWLRREQIDVLQAYFPDSSYFGLTAAWLAGVPQRIRTRNNVGHWLTPLHRRLGRVLNRLTTTTIANCRAARDALLEAERPSPESVIVLENGVDLERFLAVRPLLTTAPASACVGAVANLRHVKGLDVLVRAVAKLSATHPGLRMQVAGEGEARGDLEREAAALRISECVLLPGAISNIPEFLGRLDVAVLSSRAEGMSNAVLEYMAAGRPIVATAVGATPELIEDGVHGLLVPPGDDTALAAAIGRLLEDRELACRLGDAARRRAVERYSRAAMVRRFEEFYRKLARRPSEG